MTAGPQTMTGLRRASGATAESWHELIPIVYDELRRIAHRQLRGQPCGHTLDTTALVHEAYFKLADRTRVPYAERAHFFGIAACAMRQVLIDYARRRATLKRGGALQRIPFDEEALTADARADILLALDDAVTRLAAIDERLARVVECRFFGGMTESDTALALGVTERTVRRDWTKARLWLYGELDAGGG